MEGCAGSVWKDGGGGGGECVERWRGGGECVERWRGGGGGDGRNAFQAESTERKGGGGGVQAVGMGGGGGGRNVTCFRPRAQSEIVGMEEGTQTLFSIIQYL